MSKLKPILDLIKLPKNKFEDLEDDKLTELYVALCTHWNSSKYTSVLELVSALGAISQDDLLYKIKCLRELRRRKSYFSVYRNNTKLLAKDYPLLQIRKKHSLPAKFKEYTLADVKALDVLDLDSYYLSVYAEVMGGKYENDMPEDKLARWSKSEDEAIAILNFLVRHYQKRKGKSKIALDRMPSLMPKHVEKVKQKMNAITDRNMVRIKPSELDLLTIEERKVYYTLWIKQWNNQQIVSTSEVTERLGMRTFAECLEMTKYLSRFAENYAELKLPALVIRVENPTDDEYFMWPGAEAYKNEMAFNEDELTGATRILVTSFQINSRTVPKKIYQSMMERKRYLESKGEKVVVLTQSFEFGRQNIDTHTGEWIDKLPEAAKGTVVWKPFKHKDLYFHTFPVSPTNGQELVTDMYLKRFFSPMAEKEGVNFIFIGGPRIEWRSLFIDSAKKHSRWLISSGTAGSTFYGVRRSGQPSPQGKIAKELDQFSFTEIVVGDNGKASRAYTWEDVMEDGNGTSDGSVYCIDTVHNEVVQTSSKGTKVFDPNDMEKWPVYGMVNPDRHLPYPVTSVVKAYENIIATLKPKRIVENDVSDDGEFADYFRQTDTPEQMYHHIMDLNDPFMSFEMRVLHYARLQKLFPWLKIEEAYSNHSGVWTDKFFKDLLRVVKDKSFYANLSESVEMSRRILQYFIDDMEGEIENAANRQQRITFEIYMDDWVKGGCYYKRMHGEDAYIEKLVEFKSKYSESKEDERKAKEEFFLNAYMKDVFERRQHHKVFKHVFGEDWKLESFTSHVPFNVLLRNPKSDDGLHDYYWGEDIGDIVLNVIRHGHEVDGAHDKKGSMTKLFNSIGRILCGHFHCGAWIGKRSIVAGTMLPKLVHYMSTRLTSWTYVGIVRFNGGQCFLLDVQEDGTY